MKRINKKGQTSIEYILTTAFLFTALLSFYIFYSQVIPKQFEQSAQIILTVYEGN